MPFAILFILLVAGTVIYIFMNNHSQDFVGKKKEPNDPFDVIYLPDDLDKDKDKDESTEKNE